MKNSYSLLDTGAEHKLEQLGAVRIVRPSSLAIWKQIRPVAWADAQARFEHQQGWVFSKNLKARGEDDSWDVEAAGCKFVVRLQKNGQIGLFPEHLSYMQELRELVTSLISSGRQCRVLNLFAYTGLASIVAAKAGAHVTHVDSSKKVLDWANENARKNLIGDGQIRFIPEDALSFLRRELRRGNFYDIVIADPPSFSRLSAKQEWELGDVISELAELVGQVLKPESGGVFFASHAYELGGEVVANMLRDQVGLARWSFDVRLLSIEESQGKRHLPAGILVVGKAPIQSAWGS